MHTQQKIYSGFLKMHVGSGGMFVQSLKFIEEHSENAFDISVYGSNYLETGKNEHGYKSDRKKLRK